MMKQGGRSFRGVARWVRFWPIGIAAGLWMGLAAPGAAQPAEDVKALREEVEALKQGLRAIQREMEELKAVLRARLAAPATTALENLKLRMDGAAMLGDRTAKVALVEFVDYRCVFCASYADKTLPQLRRDYVDTGKVRFVLRDFPLDAIPNDSSRAAEAARCAGDQGKYWAMHDLLFANQDDLGGDVLKQHARALGLDLVRFTACLEAGQHAGQVLRDQAEGVAAGVAATPTFFLGLIDPGAQTIQVKQMIVGAQPYSIFKAVIDSLLATSE